MGNSESFKREAIVAVLTRLGETMFVMMSLTLAQDHKINIDKDENYKLDDLNWGVAKDSWSGWREFAHEGDSKCN